MPSIQPADMDMKDLRRDQLLDYYDDATKTLQTLIKAKESEIEYRRDLISMMEQSKTVYDTKLSKARQDYQLAKKSAPETLDLKGSSKRTSDTNMSGSTTPPLPPPTAPTSHSSQINPQTNDSNPIPSISQQSSVKGSEFDLPMPAENNENRSSLDRRLSEFLKTFPNLTQAGLAPPTSNDVPKPMPGYYTQQLGPPAPPPPMAPGPPMMAMLRLPPPTMIQINQPPPSSSSHPIHSIDHQENHDTTDMDLSDFEDSTGNTNGSSSAPGLIPMVASAMQQGAGGKNARSDSHSQGFGLGNNQQFNNPLQYSSRLNPLPFDPSIIDPGLRDASSGSSRDRHSPGDHRSSSRSGSKHGSSKTRYSSSSSTSSHSSDRSKRR